MGLQTALDWFVWALVMLLTSFVNLSGGTFTVRSAAVLLDKNAREGLLVNFQGLFQLSHSTRL